MRPSPRLEVQASEALDGLLAAWARQLDESARALRKGLHGDQQHRRAHFEERRLDRKENREAASAYALEHHVRGLLAQAAAGYDVSIGLPGGAGLAGVTSVAELSALAGLVLDSDAPVRDARQALLTSLRSGHLPRPVRVAEVLEGTGRDPRWQHRLESLGHRLETLGPAHRRGPSQLRARVEMERLEGLREVQTVLQAYGSSRLLTLVEDPRRITEDLPLDPPGMAPKTFPLGTVLDEIFQVGGAKP